MKAPASCWLDEDGALDSQVIVVALGGNLGGPAAVRERFESALASLSTLWGRAFVSPLLITAPVGEVQDQPDFINAVAAWRPAAAVDPQAALGRLQELERQHGRTRLVPGGARSLDLDLLLVGQSSHDNQALIVPHPRMHQRAFVLRPLCELFGPTLRLGKLGLRLSDCLADPAVALQATELLL